MASLLTLTLVFFHLFSLAHSDSSNLMCCESGMKVGKNVLKTDISCTPTNDVVTVNSTDDGLCMALHSACCVTVAENLACKMGRQLALADQECYAPSKPYASNMQRCCDCCKVGKLQGQNDGDCSATDGDDLNCNMAFKQCCLFAKASKTTAKPVTTSPSSNITKSCADVICDASSSDGCLDGVCQCKQGFVLGSDRSSCVDVNECAGNSPCRFNEFCFNEAGGHSCRSYCFQPSYQVVGDKECRDVNECENDPNICPTHFECLNLFGSYKCKRVNCSSGFRLVGERCIDINECAETPDICGDGGTCFNSYGRYYCQCRKGYTSDPITKKCVDQNECETHFCNHECVNTLGSYQCICPSGYTTDGPQCKDIDECGAAVSPCGTGSHCFNTFGSFECIPTTCPTNYFYQRSYRHCQKSWCNQDLTCQADPRTSVKWQTFRFYKNMRPNSLNFQYSLTGFSDAVEMHYYFDSGDDDDLFYIERIGGARDKIRIKNNQPIEGPKSFELRMHADVSLHGQLVNRFVYKMYIFVSAYPWLG